MLSTSTWLKFLTLSYSVAAVDILFYAQSDCQESSVALACGNIPSGTCCYLSKAAEKSVRVKYSVISPDAILKAWDANDCKLHAGTMLSQSFTGPAKDNCILNRDGFLGSAMWKPDLISLVGPQPPTEYRRPDTIVFTNENGEQTKIPIPAGEFAAYEKVASRGNWTAVLEHAGLLD